MSDPATQQRIAECGRALAIATPHAMTINDSVNLPTMVAGSARMAGNYLLRSFRIDLSGLPPGEVVLSPHAGEQTAMLTRFCAVVMQAFGTTVASSPPSSLDDTASKFILDFLDTQRRLEPLYGPLQQQHALDDAEMAKAAAVATATLIHQFAKHMDVNAAFGYAVYAFTEGARTVPLPAAPLVAQA